MKISNMWLDVEKNFHHWRTRFRISVSKFVQVATCEYADL